MHQLSMDFVRVTEAAAIAASAWIGTGEKEQADRAAELRRKLDEVRAVAEDRDEFEAAETPIDQAEAPEDVDERRRRIAELALAHDDLVVLFTDGIRSA